MSGSQRTIYRSQFSCSTMAVLGTKFLLSGLATCTFNHQSHLTRTMLVCLVDWLVDLFCARITDLCLHTQLILLSKSLRWLPFFWDLLHYPAVFSCEFASKYNLIYVLILMHCCCLFHCSLGCN